MAGVGVRDNGGSHCTGGRQGGSMQRAASSASEGSFWTTIELLAGRGRRRSAADADDCDAQDAPPLDARTPSALSFAHPHVRARLEKHMGSHLARLTDQGYMSELEDRIRQLNEENLNKRISSRVLDEMERLKRLILVGKTPLKECPPELFYHPVFVFWRMVNREVARASKKRAEAYLKKLKATQKIEHAFDESSEGVGEEETAEFLTDEQILKNCQDEVEAQRLVDIENGFRFNEEEYAQLKYETSEIKTLKTLSSVEDLYALADKIIGSKRLEVK